MDSQNPYAAPQAPTSRIVQTLPDEFAWRQGDVLVVEDGIELPSLCVKCGIETTDEARKLSLVWYPSWALFGLLIGGIPFVLLAIALQKKLKIFVHVCPRHRQRRRNAILGAWLGVIVGVAMFVLAGALGKAHSELSGMLALGGILLILASIITGIIMSPFLKPKRIKKKRGWLKGASPELLAMLPDYPL